MMQWIMSNLPILVIISMVLLVCAIGLGFINHITEKELKVQYNPVGDIHIHSTCVPSTRVPDDYIPTDTMCRITSSELHELYVIKAKYQYLVKEGDS